MDKSGWPQAKAMLLDLISDLRVDVTWDFVMDLEHLLSQLGVCDVLSRQEWRLLGEDRADEIETEFTSFRAVVPKEGGK